MTFKIALIRTGQLIFSTFLIAASFIIIGFFIKAGYRLFMIGYNSL